eukprot:1176158-Prorocentrum_minimum.AAC.1
MPTPRALKIRYLVPPVPRGTVYCTVKSIILTDPTFLDVARPPSRDPPPGDRLPGGDGPRFARPAAGPEIRPGVGARPGNVKEDPPI